MLKLSTRGRYAVRMLACLGLHRASGPITKFQIADSEGISADYVEQILVRLKAAGFVESRRGVHGGFLMTADPKAVTVAAVVEAMEGPLALVSCGEEACSRAADCVTRPVWQAAAAAMKQSLASVTLDELIKGKRRQGTEYQI